MQFDRNMIIGRIREGMGRIEYRVGLFVLVPAVVIVLFILVKLGYSLATSTMDVYVKVNSITSLKKGTPVQIKGHQLGRVVDVQPLFKPALHFIATLRIKKDIELYEDCAAIITNQNVIGDPVVELRNPEKKGAFLMEGDVIEGIESGSIEDIMAKVNTLLTEVTTIVTLYREVSQESRGDIRKLVTSLADEHGEHQQYSAELAEGHHRHCRQHEENFPDAGRSGQRRSRSTR